MTESGLVLGRIIPKTRAWPGWDLDMNRGGIPGDTRDNSDRVDGQKILHWARKPSPYRLGVM